MTVCIAAICEWATDEPKIVICSDKRSSSGYGHLENRFKVNPLAMGWTLMCAGNEDEISAVSRMLATEFRNAALNGTDLDETTVGPIIDRTLAARKRQLVDVLVQSRYAISYDEFRNHGKERFPDDLFRNLMYEIHEVRIDLELILCGFASGDPLIFEATRSLHAVIRDDFAVIGSGAPLAQSVLLSRQHHTQNSLSSTAYCVYEAKKYAEGEVGVGEDFTMIVSSDGDKAAMLRVAGKDWMAATYKNYGPRPIPEDIAMPDKFLMKLASEATAAEKLNEAASPTETK